MQAFEEQGGIRYIFLTHEDDVAEAARYAKHFGATRIMHRADAHAMPGTEQVIDGENPVRIAPEFVCIPVPGHTPGSMALLYHNRFLFSGDHLWWDRDIRQLETPERLVWDERKLEQSVMKLLNLAFEWVLPGHGERVHLSPSHMKKALDQLLQRRRNFQHSSLWSDNPGEPN